MRLLLDEDSGARSLLNALRTAGHDVVRVVDVEALGAGSSDDAVFRYAVADDRVLITKNGSDFLDIVMQQGVPAHPGVLTMHNQEGGASLPISTIVRAVGNIAATYQSTRALFLAMNQHVW